MNPREIKLTLTCSLTDVGGDANELVFRLKGSRRNKANNYEFYELNLIACRHSVLELQREFRKMHIRDRARLAMEQKRIEREVIELTRESA